MAVPGDRAEAQGLEECPGAAHSLAPDRDELERTLSEVRARGWALTDEQLASGVRSIAAPLRDGTGRVVAAMNVTVHAAETTVETLVEQHLPLLLRAAGEVSADLARLDALPVQVFGPTSGYAG